MRNPANTGSAKIEVGQGALNHMGFHGVQDQQNGNHHTFVVYPEGKQLVDPMCDTHLEGDKCCTNHAVLYERKGKKYTGVWNLSGSKREIWVEAGCMPSFTPPATVDMKSIRRSLCQLTP